MHRRCLFAAVYLLLAAAAFAQIATTTSLVGTVTDSSGRVIIGAKITAVNANTADTYNTSTNGEGYYRVDFVRVGTYNVTVESPGFEKFQKTGIVVDINQSVRTDFSLSPGAVSQSVTVEAEGTVIKTDDAAVSDIVTNQQLANLPMNGRDAMGLALTTPGVLQGTKSNGVPPGESFVGAGQRDIQNSMSLDGISIMNNLITTTPTQPMVETVQEMEVQTGTYSAQYGAYMGVHINMVSKSGTNQLHGNLVEFIRNDAFDARPYFLSPTAKKTVLRQNQFGFELDGPVVIPKIFNGRDKTFFMGSYEGFRSQNQSASTSTVMTPQMFKGDFSQTPTVVKDPFNNNAPYAGNKIPAAQLSPISLDLQQYYVTPNAPGVTQNLLLAVPNVLNIDQTVDRVDQNIGTKVRLFFRYQRQQEEIDNGSAVPVNAADEPVYSNNYTGGYTHTFTPTLVNDFRIGRQWFETNSLNYFYLNDIKDAGTKLGIPGFDSDTKANNPGIPDFNVSGFTGLNNAGTNWFQTDKTWQASEQISWMHGKHGIMAGAEFRKLVTGRLAGNSPRGTFTFNGQFSGYAPADFMLGIPQTLVTPVTEVWGLVAEWRDGFFVLDNWQVSRKLTLNYGIRYELPTVPYTISGYATELNAQQTASVPSNPPVPGFQFIYPNHKDWAPRFGFAYRLTAKTVIRGGYGIYYNPNQTNSFTFLNANPPFSNAATYTSLPTTPTLSLSNPTPSDSQNAAAIPNWITDNWHLPSAYMNQWSLGVERQLWRNAGLEVQHVGSHSLHLDRNFYNNTPYYPGPGAIQARRPNQLFGQIRTIQNDVIGNYEALTVAVHQRLLHGVQFNASYTWSHTLDVTGNSNNSGQPLNPYNWRADYSNASFDVPHRAVATYICEIPFFRNTSRWMEMAFGHWQFNGITTLQSGTPFNISISTDAANTSSQGTQRPNIVHTPTWNCGSGHLTGCIDLTAFSVPLLYSYGNAGRNILRGPHRFSTDFSVHKNFPIKERLRFTLRVEAFNVFNNPEFSNPAANIQNATFGNITSTSVPARQLQLGGKVSF